MAITGKWSSRLELLADGLLEAWRADTQEARDPFAKVCVVVNDAATEHWLRQYYLVEKKIPEVMLNLEFVQLQELVNDWLAAYVHRLAPQERHAKVHPYSKNVLAWRIYRLLSQEPAELQELLAYVKGAADDAATLATRRYSLAVQLSKLYDDYLNSRYQLLRNWELGKASADDAALPAWQKALYLLLVKEDAGSYAAEYAQAFQEGDAAQACDAGFPKYLSIHIFDIPYLPEAMLRMLEKLGASPQVKMTFWTFNPQGNWLGETASKSETIRQLRQRLNRERTRLWEGESPEEAATAMSQMGYDVAEERLLGALASGARAVIGAEVEDAGVGDGDVLGDEDLEFSGLKKLAGRGGVSVHSTYSARRELESLRDGLHQFFKEHPEAQPHDALVLCADWESYAPILETVFPSSPEAAGYLPVTMGGALQGDTPLTRSFHDLLEFRRNRFEVSAVFALLSVAAIREKFGLDAAGVEVLRELVRQANIHWGWDDADVRSALGGDSAVAAAGAEPYPFTWQRGLDRLAVDMLYGDECDDNLLKINKLGELLPCGRVEEQRADYVAALWKLLQQLRGLRREFAPGKLRPVAEWQEQLLGVLNSFYAESDETVEELAQARRAILDTAAAVRLAGLGESVSGEALLTAVLESIRSRVPVLRTPADAVLFAPLNSYAATPHKFVWVCGLNDGKFPKAEYRSSFDIVGRHPSLFDVSSREKDAFALLKAALSAREALAFSYVGQSSRTNEKQPPSVLLNDVIDYLRESLGDQFSQVKQFTHPLHSFSAEYFEPNSELPPSFSASSQRVAERLRAREGAETAAPRLTAFDLNFDGVTVIPLEEFAEFYASPNHFLARQRLGLKSAWFGKELADQEVLTANFDKKWQADMLLCDTADAEALAPVAVEEGMAPNRTEAAVAITEKLKGKEEFEARFLKFAKTGKNSMYFGNTCVPEQTLAGAYKAFLASSKVIDGVWKHCVMMDGKSYQIEMPFSYHSIALPVQAGGDMDFVFAYEKDDKIYESTLMRCWIYHLAGHAVGQHFVTVMFNMKEKTARTYQPMEQEDAQCLLKELLDKAVGPLPPGYPNFTMANDHKADKPFDWENVWTILKKVKVDTRN